jgi:hypothetical protein
MSSEPLYGLLAEYPDVESLVHAARALTSRGVKQVDAFTPFPVEDLSEALGQHRSRIPLVVLIGGIIGCAGGFLMQYWISVIAYPENIGGRPLNSWPSFIPVTFEMTILVGSLFAILGMLGLNGLPRPHHPLFAIPAFAHASTDGYFLCVEASDRLFDREGTRKLLMELHAREVWDVPAAS